MHVRLAEPSDAESLRRIYNEEVVGSTATFDLRPRTPEEQAVWMSEHQGTYPVVVAVEEGGLVVGFGSLSTYRDRPSYATTVENSVYVHPDHWGRGVGTLLLAALMQAARTAGHHVVVARIVGDNEASIKLHARFGFSVVGSLHEVGWKFHRWHDVLIMEAVLPEDEQA